MTITILFSLLEQPLVDIIRSGKTTFSLVKAILKVSYVLFCWFFHVELTSLTSIRELSLVLDLIIVGELNSKAMLEPIQKLSIVDSTVVEVKESFIWLILCDGVTIVYAVLELFYAW